jgi:hypothetical protein
MYFYTIGAVKGDLILSSPDIGRISNENNEISLLQTLCHQAISFSDEPQYNISKTGEMCKVNFLE